MARIFLAALMLLLVAVISFLIVQATAQSGFLYFTGLRSLLANAWSRVVLLDFGVSLAFTSCWFFAVERNKTRAFMLAILNFVLGNPVLLVYLTIKMFKVNSYRELFAGAPSEA